MKTRFIHSVFRESSFELSFRTVDKVIRYDEHPFYRQFTSAGLKAAGLVTMTLRVQDSRDPRRWSTLYIDYRRHGQEGERAIRKVVSCAAKCSKNLRNDGGNGTNQ